MTKQDQITAFLDQHITLPRMMSPYWAHQRQFVMQPRPTAEQAAQELLEMAEFRALRLGTWLGTVDGEIVTAAVESVMPPFYRQDVELLVAALKLAAEMQQAEGQGRAGKAVLVLGAAAFIGFLGMAGGAGTSAA